MKELRRELHWIKVRRTSLCTTVMDAYFAANSLDTVEYSQWIADNIRIFVEKNGALADNN